MLHCTGICCNVFYFHRLVSSNPVATFKRLGRDDTTQSRLSIWRRCPSTQLVQHSP